MDSSSDAMDVEATNSFLDEQFDVSKLQKLVAERDEMEKQIGQLLSQLTGPNGPGLVGGLVDKEGFPIADFDKVVSVRENRQKLACASFFVIIFGHLYFLVITPSNDVFIIRTNNFQLLIALESFSPERKRFFCFPPFRSSE